MPNFQLPRGLPALRLPQMVTPRSAAPEDVVAAAAATEADILNSLLKGPASALGIALPEIPGPASVLAQMLPQKRGQGRSGNNQSGTKTPPTQGEGRGLVFE